MALCLEQVLCQEPATSPDSLDLFGLLGLAARPAWRGTSVTSLDELDEAVVNATEGQGDPLRGDRRDDGGGQTCVIGDVQDGVLLHLQYTFLLSVCIADTSTEKTSIQR